MCRCCGRNKKIKARGLCKGCWERGRRLDMLDDPPPLWHNVLARIEDYAELTREHKLSRREAADRLGFSKRTAERYEKRLGRC